MFSEFKDKLFVDFLIANKLCDEARHFILHSIAMVDQDTLAMVVIQSTKTFLQSLGRYGNSAFLFPTYGVGELPQAFSRFFENKVFLNEYRTYIILIILLLLGNYLVYIYILNSHFRSIASLSIVFRIN